MGIIWCIIIFSGGSRYIFFAVAIFAILIGFFGLQQRDIFPNENYILLKPEEKKSDVGNTNEKYVTSGLTNESEQDLYRHLIQLLTEKAFYKEKNLSLAGLASKLEIHPNYLSQIINKKTEKSFCDFINTFRVNEFIRLVKIPENKQFTLIALAYECGFNSKSSFNRYFKKHTGKTPSQYTD